MLANPFVIMLLCTTAAGACILAGGVLARVERIRPLWLETEFRHSVIAFGGGVLVAAVGLVLVPEGIASMDSPAGSVLAFITGGLVFFAIERMLAYRRHENPQLMAMLLDYVPESLALGGMFATGAASAPLLALLIGLQNFPEGFNAYRELKSSDRGAGRVLATMAALILLGPLAGCAGWLVGGEHEAILGGVMLFAAGGILYLVFQDIAPQSRIRHHRGPALGAVAGFCLGMLGRLLVGEP